MPEVQPLEPPEAGECADDETLDELVIFSTPPTAADPYPDGWRSHLRALYFDDAASALQYVHKLRRHFDWWVEDEWNAWGRDLHGADEDEEPYEEFCEQIDRDCRLERAPGMVLVRLVEAAPRQAEGLLTWLGQRPQYEFDRWMWDKIVKQALRQPDRAVKPACQARSRPRGAGRPRARRAAAARQGNSGDSDPADDDEVAPPVAAPREGVAA